MAGPGRGRHWRLIGVAAIAVVAAVVGWFAGRNISSPEDVASDVDPPEPSLITVPVELRELSTSVVIRGDVLLEGSFDIQIDSSAGLETGGVAVTTGTPLLERDLVEEGAVLLEVSERPVIALQGELPMFRSFAPGSRGDDVQQLEDALVRLGFDPGAADGVYDQDTETAVEALYIQAGYIAAGLTDEERSRLDAARAAVDQAKSALTSAQSSLSQARQPVAQSTRLQLEQARDGARDGVDLAKAQADEAKAVAAQAVADAVVAVDEATAAVELATARLAEAEAGTHPDTGEPPTEDELAQLAEDVDAATNVLTAAEAAVATAEASEAVVAEQQESFIDDAEANLAIAQAQLNELLAAPDTTFESQAVTDAQDRVNEAEAELAVVEAETGIRVPRAEIVFIDTLPRRVQRLNVERGDIVSGTAMTVSGATVTIESAVASSDRPLLKVGDVATADDQSLGIEFTAEITQLADNPGGRVSDTRYYVELHPTDDIEDDVAGLNLRVTIPISTTGGEVMTVPLAALSAGADGSVRVEVEDPEGSGTTRTVTVATGLETTGFVEVRPVEGDLEPDDRVVVGR